MFHPRPSPCSSWQKSARPQTPKRGHLEGNENYESPNPRQAWRHLSHRPSRHGRRDSRTWQGRHPIAAGEQWASKWSFREVIEEDLIDYARIDLCIVGGITEAAKITLGRDALHQHRSPQSPWTGKCRRLRRALYGVNERRRPGDAAKTRQLTCSRNRLRGKTGSPGALIPRDWAWTWIWMQRRGT